ncbi:MAG TPA: hypothetical protein VF234_02735, partial [Limnochordia bacterium]
NSRNLLEAYRRDCNEAVVWLSASLPAGMLTAARQALDEAISRAMSAQAPPEQALRQGRGPAEAAIAEFLEKLAVR